MRTTLTLDPDVAAMLMEYRKCHDLGLKDAVNEALRNGLHPQINLLSLYVYATLNFTYFLLGDFTSFRCCNSTVLAYRKFLRKARPISIANAK